MTEQAYGMGLETDTMGFDLPDTTVTTNGVVDHEGPPDEPQEDDLWAINHDDDEQTIKDSLPPQGDYEVQLQAGPRTVKEVEGTKLPDQRFFGIGIREDGEKTHKARIRFSLCSRKFIKANGKTHWPYLMYISAGKAFAAANGRKHESYDELEEYLTSSYVRVRVTHTTNNDYMAVEVKAFSMEVPF